MGEKLLTTIKEYVIGLEKGLLPYIIKPCIFIGHRFILVYFKFNFKKKLFLI